MCLAYPARVVTVEDGAAVVVTGVRHQRVLLALLDEPVSVGDWLLVQTGLALGRPDEADAGARLDLLNSVGGGDDPRDP
jgi:hydrogenase expression/formation protein HypC